MKLRMFLHSGERKRSPDFSRGNPGSTESVGSTSGDNNKRDSSVLVDRELYFHKKKEKDQTLFLRNEPSSSNIHMNRLDDTIYGHNIPQTFVDTATDMKRDISWKNREHCSKNVRHRDPLLIPRNLSSDGSVYGNSYQTFPVRVQAHLSENCPLPGSNSRHVGATNGFSHSNSAFTKLIRREPHPVLDDKNVCGYLEDNAASANPSECELRTDPCRLKSMSVCSRVPCCTSSCASCRKCCCSDDSGSHKTTFDNDQRTYFLNRTDGSHPVQSTPRKSLINDQNCCGFDNCPERDSLCFFKDPVKKSHKLNCCSACEQIVESEFLKRHCCPRSGDHVSEKNI